MTADTAWPPVSEEWFRRALAAAPPLTEWQRDRLAVLLDLTDGGGDE